MLTLIDCWEGALDLNEPLLLDNGIVGLIIRLNSISGELHMDEQFVAQWEQAANFLRAPYFVYSPWYSGHANAEWMLSHLPASGVTRVFIDVEVRKDGYSPETYADQLQICINDSRAVYPKTTIYTGGWFLPIVAHWPTNVDYWWGRYPYTLCPQGDRQYWSWSKWFEVSNNYGYDPDPRHLCPGTIGLWQCSGDKLIMPGCADRAIDLNLFQGSMAMLEDYWSAEMPGMSLSDKVEILWREAAVHGWNLER